MRFSLTIPFISCLLASTAYARRVPPNVRQFFQNHKNFCNNVIAQVGDFVYCGDQDNVIFLKGPGNQYDNMDIDCDGRHRLAGKCSNDQAGQGETAFKDLVKKYSKGTVKDLNANKVPYVVFGNSGANQTFDPTQSSMTPLSVMAVVCGNKLVYGIWGDTNGGTDTGEASISLAEMCFPNEDITGNSGHDVNDVLYIGFTGTPEAAAEKYHWRARNAREFERSISAIGDKLVAQL